jgi:thiamine-monophosphate kinase
MDLDVSIIGHITDKASGTNLVDKSNNVVKLQAQGWKAF